MKKTIASLLLIAVIVSLFGACAVPASVTVEPAATQSAASEPTVSAVSQTSAPASTPEAPQATATPSAAPSDNAIIEKTKEFLMHGQEDKPEANKLHWTQAFLDQVDIEAVYQQYVADGGKTDDVLSFAQYLTDNAPVPDNWKQLFEANLLSEYGVTPSKYEDLGDGYYQVYIKSESKEVPYVGVNSRTGWFHG